MLHNTGGSQALLPAWLVLGQHKSSNLPNPALPGGADTASVSHWETPTPPIPRRVFRKSHSVWVRVCPCRGGRSGQRMAQSEAEEKKVRERKPGCSSSPGVQGELETVTLGSEGTDATEGI